MPEQREELEGFTESTFSDGGISHQVFRAGTGPAVVLIHEVPGIHPGVLDLARRLIDQGTTGGVRRNASPPCGGNSVRASNALRSTRRRAIRSASPRPRTAS